MDIIPNIIYNILLIVNYFLIYIVFFCQIFTELNGDISQLSE